MGIVEKQATKNALYSYLGAGLGFITVMLLSHLPSASDNGVIRILISYSALFAQFANLGFTTVTIRFFPYFRNKDKGHHGFLFYALIVTLIGFIICWIVFLFLKPHLIESNRVKSPLFVTYLFYLMPLTLFTVFFNILDSYLRAVYSSVIGSVSKEFLQRIFILIALLFYFFNLISRDLFMLLYIGFTCLPTLLLVLYIIKLKEWHVRPVKNFITKELKKEMIDLGLFSILAGGAGAIILNIDAIMVNQLLGEKQTGIYGIAFYFGTLLLIPARSIYRITSSIVAENFKNNRLAEIHKLYKQSCNTQLAIGSLLYIGIVININNIMQFLPDEFAGGKNVILILSSGYLIEMATGINQVIIANSKYYRYDAYFVFLIVGLTVGANWILIPFYGITGSAIATMITVVFANILRFLFLRIKYKMQPYDLNSLKLLIITLLSFLPSCFLPFIHDVYTDLVIRSGITTSIFVLLLLKMNAAPELNKKIIKILKRFSLTI